MSNRRFLCLAIKEKTEVAWTLVLHAVTAMG
jgi:hypothetical protein